MIIINFCLFALLHANAKYRGRNYRSVRLTIDFNIFIWIIYSKFKKKTKQGEFHSVLFS